MCKSSKTYDVQMVTKCVYCLHASAV